jgi:putative ABC transport system permease protein
MLVGLINERMAQAYWPGQDPIGRRFRIGMNPQRPWVTVVGIVRDVRHNGVTNVVKEKFYIPHAQWHRSVGPMRSMFLVVRGDADVNRLTAAVRSELRAIDPNVPVANVRPMSEVVATSLATPRLTGFLLGTFAVIALVLAAVGIYSVLAYLVARRTHEIGIRLAIGADRAQVVRMIIGQGVSLTVMGLLVGIAGAAGLTRLMASVLYDVSPSDPWTYAAVVVGLLGVAGLASAVPALRAAMVDPVTALRSE